MVQNVAPCCAVLRHGSPLSAGACEAVQKSRSQHITSLFPSALRAWRQAGRLSSFLTTAGAPAERFDLKKTSPAADSVSTRCACVSALRRALLSADKRG